jgi:hypothetical protein
VGENRGNLFDHGHVGTTFEFPEKDNPNGSIPAEALDLSPHRYLPTDLKQT